LRDAYKRRLVLPFGERQKAPPRVSASFDETNLGLKCGKNKAISMMFQHGLHALKSWLRVSLYIGREVRTAREQA
jgi:hypothetical protein